MKLFRCKSKALHIRPNFCGFRMTPQEINRHLQREVLRYTKLGILSGDALDVTINAVCGLEKPKRLFPDLRDVLNAQDKVRNAVVMPDSEYHAKDFDVPE